MHPERAVGAAAVAVVKAHGFGATTQGNPCGPPNPDRGHRVHGRVGHKARACDGGSVRLQQVDHNHEGGHQRRWRDGRHPGVVRAGPGKTKLYVDMIQAGIVNPLKVVRTALVDAAGVACLLATNGACIVEVPEERKPVGMCGMGGRGGFQW